MSVQIDDALMISVLSLGEMRRGLLSLPAGQRRSSLEAWLIRTETAFGPRILPVDRAVATLWPEIAIANRAAGHKPGAIDELIAATALAHNLTLVTRNVRDFEASGCARLSPWSA